MPWGLTGKRIALGLAGLGLAWALIWPDVFAAVRAYPGRYVEARNLNIPLGWKEYWDKYYPGVPPPKFRRKHPSDLQIYGRRDAALKTPIREATNGLIAEFPVGSAFDPAVASETYTVPTWYVGKEWARRMGEAIKVRNVTQAREFAALAQKLAAALRKHAEQSSMRFANDIDEALLSHAVNACITLGPEDPLGKFARELAQGYDPRIEPSRKALDYAICGAFEGRYYAPRAPLATLAERSHIVEEAIAITQEWEKPPFKDCVHVWENLCSTEQISFLPQRFMYRQIRPSSFFKYQFREAANIAMANASIAALDKARGAPEYEPGGHPFSEQDPWSIAVSAEVTQEPGGIRVRWAVPDNMKLWPDEGTRADRLNGTPELLPYPTRSKPAK